MVYRCAQSVRESPGDHEIYICSSNRRDVPCKLLYLVWAYHIKLFKPGGEYLFIFALDRYPFDAAVESVVVLAIEASSEGESLMHPWIGSAM